MEPLTAALAPKEAHGEQAHRTAPLQYVGSPSARANAAAPCTGCADPSRAGGADRTPDAATKALMGSATNASAAHAGGDCGTSHSRLCLPENTTARLAAAPAVGSDSSAALMLGVRAQL